MFLPALITETIGNWASGDCAEFVFLASAGARGAKQKADATSASALFLPRLGIRRARELGFSIGDIRALLALAAPFRASCAEVREIAWTHLDDVRAKLVDLTKLEHILAETVARCSGGPAPSCPVLDILAKQG